MFEKDGLVPADALSGMECRVSTIAPPLPDPFSPSRPSVSAVFVPAPVFRSREAYLLPCEPEIHADGLRRGSADEVAEEAPEDTSILGVA